MLIAILLSASVAGPPTKCEVLTPVVEQYVYGGQTRSRSLIFGLLATNTSVDVRCALAAAISDFTAAHASEAPPADDDGHTRGITRAKLLLAYLADQAAP